MSTRFTQSQVLGEGDRKEQPSIGHQAVVVEGDVDAVGCSDGSIFWVLLERVGLVSARRTIIPRNQMGLKRHVRIVFNPETRYTFNPGYETYFNAYVPHTRG